MYSWGKVVEVDLKDGKVEKKELKEDFKKVPGATCWAAKWLNELVPGDSDPLGPKNILILIPGLLCGSPIPTSGKTGFFSKSPLTGGWEESWIGSTLGMELRQAGISALILKGCAEKPSYLYIQDDKIELRDAADLWGLDTFEAQKKLEEALNKGYRRCVVASIGPAGENQVKFASIDCEGRQAGRGGIGAVMGSKNLKAIAVYGTKDLEFDDDEAVKELSKKLYAETRMEGNFEDDEYWGTASAFEFINEKLGLLPTRNWSKGFFEQGKELDPHYWVGKYSVKNKGCVSCSKPCGKLFIIARGPHAGTMVDGPDYETLFSLGSNLENPSIEWVAKLNELCDRLGLDTISAGGVIGFVMDLYEKGILKKEDLGFELKFGFQENIEELLRMISNREKIGDILAEGVKQASKLIGQTAQIYSVQVGGMEPPGYEPRGTKGMGLSFLTSPRGACHLRSCAYGTELTGKFWKFKKVDRFSPKGKGEEVAELEDLMTLYDSMGVCKFSRGIFVDHFDSMAKAVVGLEVTNESLLKEMGKVNRLKYEFNKKCGIDKKKEKLPWKYKHLPLPSGGSAGCVLSEAEEKEMIEDYYRYRGWD
jgi:aldehyde:ferredoxin oxidoreductase